MVLTNLLVVVSHFMEDTMLIWELLICMTVGLKHFKKKRCPKLLCVPSVHAVIKLCHFQDDDDEIDPKCRLSK